VANLLQDGVADLLQDLQQMLVLRISACPALPCPAFLTLTACALQITGSFISSTGPLRDETAVPDFYRMFAEEKAKPMILPQTAAWYNLCDKTAAPCRRLVGGAAIAPVNEPAGGASGSSTSGSPCLQLSSWLFALSGVSAWCLPGIPRVQ
jgi:hypothetical protein